MFAAAIYQKAKSAERKVHGAKSGRNQARASGGPLLAGTHRMFLHPLSCEMSIREAHQRLSTQGFCWGLFTWAPLEICYVPKFQIPRRKAGVQHKPYSFICSGNGGNLPKIQLSSPSRATFVTQSCDIYSFLYTDKLG